MNLLVRFVDRAAVCLGLFGILGILAMMLHITADIVMRSAFSISIPATLEVVTRYYMVAMALLPLAWVEWRKQMIFVESLSALVGQKVTRWLDALVSLFSGVLYLVLVVATWSKAVEQYDISAYVLSLNVQLPVWPSYFILPISFLLAALVAFARIPLILTNKDYLHRV